MGRLRIGDFAIMRHAGAVDPTLCRIGSHREAWEISPALQIKIAPAIGALAYFTY
jgi:hypothetical protein